MCALAAQVYRGDQIESEHEADVAVVDNRGEIVAASGNPHRCVFLRSAAKPLQAVTVINTGAAETFGFDWRDIAILCASHAAGPEHLEAVLRVLKKAGLTPADLRCGPHWPLDERTQASLRQQGKKPQPLHNNCSGKHAGMLAAALQLGADLTTYPEPEHPVQQRNRETIARLGRVAKEDLWVATDGCGVPTFGVALASAAWSFLQLAHPERAPETDRVALHTIREAMITHPALISQAGHFNTVLMEATKGNIVAKGGAEGVFCLGVREPGYGIAVKIRDGSGRCLPVVIMEVLKQLGVGGKGLEKFRVLPVYNTRGEIVGEIRPTLSLRQFTAKAKGKG